MRLASYRAGGRQGFGTVVEGGIVAMGGRLGGRFPTLRAALAANALEEIRRAAEGAAVDLLLSEVALLPVIPDPQKIFCAGINYRSHAEETGRDMPPKPSMFARYPNTLLGHDAPMIRPRVSTAFDFEGELAIIIGRPGRYVRPEDALAHVAGYTCFNDGSVRDYQKISVTAGKNFPSTGPLGPWMVTADEIPDPTRLTLTTRLNGQEVQRSGTDLLIYSVPTIISYVSEFTTLEPGDVIATGTPAGVGHRRDPPLWMKAGDVIEVEITGIGTLRNRVADEPASPSLRSP